MSSMFSIDVTLRGDRGDRPFLLEEMAAAGWRDSLGGSIVYLPETDHGAFGWTEVPESRRESVWQELRRTCPTEWTAGLVMYWEDTGHGGEFLLFPDGDLSAVMSARLRRVPGQPLPLPEIDWYVRRIVAPFGRQVESFAATYSV